MTIVLFTVRACLFALGAVTHLVERPLQRAWTFCRTGRSYRPARAPCLRKSIESVSAAPVSPRSLPTGTTTHRGQPFELTLPPEAAWLRVCRAMAVSGRADETSHATRVIRGRVRYGLQTVRLTAAVESSPRSDRSFLVIDVSGGDIWGVATRKVTQRLLDLVN